jgi:hypothetical protein
MSELVRAMLDLDWRKRPSTVNILNEIGDPEINWQELLLKRAVEHQYPHEMSPSWRKMIWKSYWYLHLLRAFLIQAVRVVVGSQNRL